MRNMERRNAITTAYILGMITGSVMALVIMHAALFAPVVGQ